MSNLSDQIVERITIFNDSDLHQKLLLIVEYKNRSLPGQNIVRQGLVVGRTLDQSALDELMRSGNPMAAAHKVDELTGEIVEEFGVPEEDQYDEALWLAENCEQVLNEVNSNMLRGAGAPQSLFPKLALVRVFSFVVGVASFLTLQYYFSRPWWQSLIVALIAFLVVQFVLNAVVRVKANPINSVDPFWAEELASARSTLTSATHAAAKMKESLELGEAYLGSRNYKLARESLEEALDCARSLRDPDAIRYCHDSLGKALLGMREYEAAQYHSKRALRIARWRGDSIGEFAALLGLGEASGLQGAHERALSLFQQARQIAERASVPELIESSLESEATAQAALGHHSEALSSFKTAAELARGRGDRNKYAFYLNLIGREAGAAGRDEEGLDVSQRVLAMAREAGNRSVEAASLSNIGVHFRNLGKLDQAVTSFESAMEATRLWAAERPEVFETRVNSESLFEDFHERERKDLKRLKVDIFRNLGGVYTDLSDHDRSLEYALEALRIAEDIGDKDLTMRSLRAVGVAYGRRGDHSRAIEYHQQALELAEQLQSLSYREWCLGILGVTYRKSGDLDRSIDYLNRALPLARELGNAYTKICLFDLGESYYEKSDYEDAYLCLTESMKLTESVRGRMDTERARISLAESHSRLAELTVLTCLRLGKEDEAFEFAEHGKSRALIDLLGNARIDPRDQADRVLLEEADGLRDQIERLRRKLYAPAQADGERAQADALIEKLRALEELELETWQKIRNNNPEFASLKQVEPLNRDDLSELLASHEALIEFFATPEDLVCFVATSDSLNIKRVPLTRDQVGGLVLAEVTRESRGLLNASLAGLYQSLIAPLIGLLREKEIKHLIIAPHGKLHLLPFGALYELAEDDRRYLLDEFSISYTPSASVLKFSLEKCTNIFNSLLAIDNPDGSLQFASEEVAGIIELFPDARVLAGAQATRSELLSCAEDFGLAHFACHGVFRGDVPEQSGLLLADGSLTMLDIFNQMKLSAQLVTLSACQTAKSRPSGGDEVVGLPRALLYAGAGAVVASLWNVNDHATSILFQHFYSRLKKGVSPVSALREAQLATRDYERDGKRPYRDPYYWAAFILIGAGG